MRSDDLTESSASAVVLSIRMNNTAVKTGVRTFSDVIATNVHEHVIVGASERVEEQITNVAAGSVVRTARTAARALIVRD